jgi:hypothetical protein
MTNEIETVYYPAPEGYTFDPITQLKGLADGASAFFTVTGKCGRARVAIEATVTRPRLLQSAGIFGNQYLKTQPGGAIYSYKSNEKKYPVPADSTGEANIGSNEEFHIPSDITLDGKLLVGEDETGLNPSTPDEYESLDTGRMDPDPFGMDDGLLADAFAYYSLPGNNDNGLVADISNDRLKIGPHDTVILNGGNYYLTDLYIAAGGTLIANTSGTNPVTIYLNGSMTAQPNSEINVTNGLPSQFYIFSNSTDPIDVQPNGDFSGFVYAPKAPLTIKPNGNINGVFWGNEADIQPGNDIFIDVSLLDKFRSTQVKLVQWKEING